MLAFLPYPQFHALADEETLPVETTIRIQDIELFPTPTPYSLTVIEVGKSNYDIQKEIEEKAEAERVAAETKRIADEKAAYIALQSKKKAQVVQSTPKPISTPKPTVSYNSGSVNDMARTAVIAKWGEHEVEAMIFIISKESGGNPKAVNKSSGACGIPQALPCSKLLNVIGSLDNVQGQIDWIVNYVSSRYGTPTKAKAFWQKNHWY